MRNPTTMNAKAWPGLGIPTRHKVSGLERSFTAGLAGRELHLYT